MKHADVIASLKCHAPYLQDAVHNQIADGMAADGLLDHDGAIRATAAKSGHRFGSLSANEAAEPSDFNAVEVKNILHEIRACGWYDVPEDKPITVADLDAHLSTGPQFIERRWVLKTRMARAGMLP